MKDNTATLKVILFLYICIHSSHSKKKKKNVENVSNVVAMPLPHSDWMCMTLVVNM